MIRFLMAAGLGLMLMGSAAEARPVDYNDPQQHGAYRADMPSVPINQPGYIYNGQTYQGSIPVPNNNNYQLQQYPYGYWPYDNGSNHPGDGYYYNNGWNNGWNNGYNNGYHYVPYSTPGVYQQPYYNNSGNLLNGVLNNILYRR